MKKSPTTFVEALNVIRAIHNALLPFRSPDFGLIKDGCEGAFDGHIVGVLSLSAPLILADRVPSEERAGMNFGQALDAIKSGQSVARAGWNGKGQFVYLVPGVAKAHFDEGVMVHYAAFLALKSVDGTVNTWAPSVSDALAEDWALAP